MQLTFGFFCGVTSLKWDADSKVENSYNANKDKCLVKSKILTRNKTLLIIESITSI